MKNDAVNSMLREIVLVLVDAGWPKTAIGKLLLGVNGQAHLNHWLKESSGGPNNDFGLKPLARIAKLLNYELHLVFVKPEATGMEDFIETQNINFFTELKESIINCLSETMKVPKISRANKTQLDQVLDDIVSGVIGIPVTPEPQLTPDMIEMLEDEKPPIAV